MFPTSSLVFSPTGRSPEIKSARTTIFLLNFLTSAHRIRFETNNGTRRRWCCTDAPLVKTRRGELVLDIDEVHMPRLLSVNVGLPADVMWSGKTVRTGI